MAEVDLLDLKVFKKSEDEQVKIANSCKKIMDDILIKRSEISFLRSDIDYIVTGTSNF